MQHAPNESSGAPLPGPAPGPPVRFLGGHVGALLPFGLFLGGVTWLGLAGAPDERGFWPVLVAALVLGVALARDRHAYSEAVIRGMASPVLMMMIMAWLLAGALGALINGAGFVDALVVLAGRAGVTGGAFVAFAFLVAAGVSTATGTSLGTVILCAPLLYPPGVPLGADPAMLIGAILGGATFGDNVSPVSDTTIASATTQGADIGGVVRSRLRYALPAAAVSLMVAISFGGSAAGVAGAGGGPVGVGAAAVTPATAAADFTGSMAGLWMALVPALVIGMLLRGRHLVESLLTGVAAAAFLGMATGTVTPSRIVAIDTDSFLAGGLVLEGMERGVGVSIFTVLLMGLVGGLEASGVVRRVVRGVQRRARTAASGEWWIFGAVSAAVVLTTHSVVAILTVGRLARETGESVGIGAFRRSNILDVAVCTYPFLFPFFVPTILAASTTAAGADVGAPRLSPLEVGLHNVHSWALLAVLLLALATGWGRGSGRPGASGAP